jgi:hypothetical protein
LIDFLVFTIGRFSPFSRDWSISSEMFTIFYVTSL